MADNAVMPFPLNRLPLELRWKVWNQALLSESGGRIVMVWGAPHDNWGILLCRHLVSPFLLVNTESRKEALRFYSTSVKVFRRRDRIERGLLHLSPAHDTFLYAVADKFPRNMLPDCDEIWNYRYIFSINDDLPTILPSSMLSDEMLKPIRKFCLLVEWESLIYMLPSAEDHNRHGGCGHLKFGGFDIFEELPVLDSRIVLLVPFDSIGRLVEFINDKGWAGLEAFTQYSNKPCSFARLHKGNYEFLREYELITPAEFTSIMNARPLACTPEQ